MKEGKENYKKNIILLGLVSLFTDFSNEVLLRTVPLFLANVLGVGTSVIGFVEGMAESTSTLLKILSGWFSDFVGKRKTLTVVGYSLSSLSKPFMYFAGSWVSIFWIRFVDRVGKGIRTSPRDALIADSAEPGQVGRAFGIHRMLDPLGAVFGTLLAGWFIWNFGKNQVLMSREVFKILVLMSLVPAGISMALLVFGVREPDKGLTEDLGQDSSKNKSTLSFALKGVKREFIIFLIINVVFTLGNSSDAFLVLRAQNLGINLAGIMFLLAMFNIVSSVLAFPAGKISDRIGRKKLLVVGWIVYSITYLGFAFAKTPLHIWVLYTLYGGYYGIADGVARALVADVVEPQKRGIAYGLYNGAIGITVLPASLIAGMLWDKLGPAYPFYLGAVLAIVAALGLWLLIKETPDGSSLPARDPR